MSAAAPHCTLHIVLHSGPSAAHAPNQARAAAGRDGGEVEGGGPHGRGMTRLVNKPRFSLNIVFLFVNLVFSFCNSKPWGSAFLIPDSDQFRTGTLLAEAGKQLPAAVAAAAAALGCRRRWWRR